MQNISIFDQRRSNIHISVNQDLCEKVHTGVVLVKNQTETVIPTRRSERQNTV